ncbi:carbohydrate ABC transporter permease [Paenibacillus cymbidii]|uniref:carbohydrate ABC transporter permease n=1 Tax=Paenibacillus cymbidii TaxID=1639034 RepID=UPI0010804FD6|nr:carbohydrate ABC transporter permease [Paenibacillus cymbidii]
MGKRIGLGERLFDVAVYAFLLLLMAATLYPLLHVAFASVSEAADIVRHRGILLRPLGFSLAAYRNVLTNEAVILGYRNTLFIVVFGVAFNMAITSLGAFVLSRKNVLWNNAFMVVIVLTMFFSGGLIPLYLVVKGVGLLDSIWSVIVPFAVSSFNLIILRTAFMAVPDALEESAKIDGASHFVILLRIVLPLSFPVIAVISLYYAVDKWNTWFWASIFIKNTDLFPLQLVLRQILIANSTEGFASGSGVSGDHYQIGETIKYATIMVATVPILCVYPFVQKYFVKGVMIGALKG